MVLDTQQNKNERPEPLSGKHKNSFAYLTIRDRLPDILTKIIDRFVKLASKELSVGNNEEAEDSKAVISKLSKLKNEMQTDKPLVTLDDNWYDVRVWNEFLSKVSENMASNDTIALPPSWFSVPWLYCECYLYRRVFEILQLSNFHMSFDPFFEQKSNAFHSSSEAIQNLASNLAAMTTDNSGSHNGDNESPPEDILRTRFEILLEYCLWGNKCDLSISAGRQVDNQLRESSQLKDLSKNILSNHTESIWELLCHIKSSDSFKSENGVVRFDFVLDNSGFELYTDLCLAEYLIRANYCQLVYFHVKSIPWFVSDVTKDDFHWTLEQCASSDNAFLSQLGHTWKKRVDDGNFVVIENTFWTSPYDYAAMRTVNHELYRFLAGSQLVIFKGDLNYRKLIGDRNWSHCTPFSEALHGFCPAALCSLRTLKADLVVGLEKGQSEALDKQQKNWMVCGDFAVVQFCHSL